jgi:NlpC/P60 family putative phage cell wall peptidase
MPSRQQIITEAREWIGTRFHHQGRVKKTMAHRGGCDCIGLLIGVADAVGLNHHGMSFSSLDRKDYAKLPDGVKLRAAFSYYLQEISTFEADRADILLFRFDKDPQHVGMISDKMGEQYQLIHCYAQARGVVEHRLDKHWQEKIVAAFRFYGVES